jgi:hypothetical protein
MESDASVAELSNIHPTRTNMKTRTTIISRLLALAFAIVVLSTSLQGAPEVAGTYVSSKNPKEYTELKSDGSFVCHQHGGSFTGKYVIQGTTLTLIVPGGKGANGTIKGNIMTDNEGVRWIKK